MAPALRIREAKPVNERRVNTQFGQQFDSARLHFSVTYKNLMADLGTILDQLFNI